MLVDVHAHLDHLLLKNDLNNLLQRSKDMIIVTNGINPETNRFALDLAKENKNIRAALGIYPSTALKHELKEFGYELGYKDFNTKEELKWIGKNAKEEKVFGIGEIGLDYFVVKNETKSQKDEQQDIFVQQLKLAKKINKPAIVHSRSAEEDVIQLLEEAKNKKVILHCFCGSKKLVKRVVENKWHFSITANVQRSSQMQMIVQNTPFNQLLTETDSPYLGLEKDKLNEPLNVKLAIQEIAKIKQLQPEEVEKIVFKNFMELCSV